MTRNTLRTAAVALLTGITLTAGAVSPAAAFGNDPAKAKQEQPQSVKADSRKYCMDTMITGSRIPKRECRTRAGWLDQGVDPIEVMKQAR